MIQRIQTLFIIGISALMMITIFVPFWQSEAIEKTTGIAGMAHLDPIAIHFIANSQASMENKGDTYYLAALAMLASLTAMFAMFQYRNRKLQTKLCLFNYLILIGLEGSYFIAIDKAQIIFEVSNTSFDTGFFLPLVAIVFNFFALRYIKKDEDLIKSVDRIR